MRVSPIALGIAEAPLVVSTAIRERTDAHGRVGTSADPILHRAGARTPLLVECRRQIPEPSVLRASVAFLEEVVADTPSVFVAGDPLVAEEVEVRIAHTERGGGWGCGRRGQRRL